MDLSALNIPKDLKNAAEIFRKSGYQCWLVGGAVRDGFLGRTTDDYDLATNASPKAVMKLFHRSIPTGIQHGTVTIMLGSHQFETTTFRTDGIYSDKRHPDTVKHLNSIEEDLARRDFTINSIALDLISNSILDPFNGRNDIKQKNIKAIGNPRKRFSEDSLRTIRACRFASQLGFSIDPETLAAIPFHLEGLRSLSAERIWDELKKIFLSPRPSTAFEFFRETGMLKILLPELDACSAVIRKGRYDDNIFNHALYCCDAVNPKNMPLRVAALFHNIGMSPWRPSTETTDLKAGEVRAAEICEAILGRYKASNADKNRIVRLVRHQRLHYSPLWTNADIRRFITRVGLDIVHDLITLNSISLSSGSSKGEEENNLQELKERVEGIIRRGDALSLKNLKINGSILMKALKIGPCPEVGEVLKYLFECVLDDPSVNEREKLINIARSLFSN